MTDSIRVLVSVELTVEEYRKAERIARRRGISRDDYLAGGVLREVRLTNLERRITHMNEAGASDADIADATGVTLRRVAEVRRALELEPNPRYARRTA